jgi:hypothetical protein
MSAFSYRTCRHCLGEGCPHCRNGQVRSRVYSRKDLEAAALRNRVFGATGAFNQRRADTDATLALLRAKRANSHHYLAALYPVTRL